MTAKREPAFVRETLAWCNRQRRRQGKKPLVRLPRGIQSDPFSCPCGAATGLKVFSEIAEPQDHAVFERIVLPRPVRKFVAAFDDGELPQYVKKAKP